MDDLVQVGGATYRRSGGGWIVTGAARECAVGPKMCAMLDRIAELESAAPVAPVVTEATRDKCADEYMAANRMGLSHEQCIGVALDAFVTLYSLTPASEVQP